MSDLASDPKVLWLVPKTCWDLLFSFSFSKACFMFMVSVGLNLGIVASSAFLKIPQIRAIFLVKSEASYPFSAILMEIANCLITVAYNRFHHNPFSIYGESVFIAVQLFICLVLLLMYKTSIIKSFSVLLLVSAASAGLLSPYIPAKVLDMMVAGQGVLSVVSRVPVIISILKMKSSSGISLFTFILQVVGSLVRVGTVFAATHNMLATSPYVFSFVSNLVVVILCLVYPKTTKDTDDDMPNSDVSETDESGTLNDA